MKVAKETHFRSTAPEHPHPAEVQKKSARRGNADHLRTPVLSSATVNKHIFLVAVAVQVTEHHEWPFPRRHVQHVLKLEGRELNKRNNRKALGAS